MCRSATILCTTWRRRAEWPPSFQAVNNPRGRFTHSLVTEPPVNIAPPLLQWLWFPSIQKVTFDASCYSLPRANSPWWAELKCLEKRVTIFWNKIPPLERVTQEKRKRGENTMCHDNLESKVEFLLDGHLRERSFSRRLHGSCYVIWRAQLSGFSLLFTLACRSGRARKRILPIADDNIL